MSLQTWKEEFYPVKACTVSKDDALEHSLRKWRGLLPENLEKHGCLIKPGATAFVVELGAESFSNHVRINGDTCALCCHHYDASRRKKSHACEGCPLYEYLGKNDCDNDTGLFLASLENPQLMVEVLEGRSG